MRDSTTTQHTPGPWTVDYVIDGGYQVSGTEEGDRVVIAHRNEVPMRHEEFCANAHLIAAAPELLEALYHMQHCAHCAEDRWSECEGGRKAENAIAKADGKAAPHA